MAIADLKKVLGGGGVLVGQTISLSAICPVRYETITGEIFLRSGFIESDTTKFDTEFWSNSKGVYLLSSKVIDGDGDLILCPVYAQSSDGNTLVVVGNKTSNNVSYKSSDGGLTWTTANTFASGAGINSISTNGSSQYIVVLSNSSNNIMKSDNGTSWNFVTSGFTTNILSSYYQNGRWFAGSNGQGLSSSDNRDSWTNRIPSVIVNKITGDGVSKLWFVSDQGSGDNSSKIYSSVDNGLTWSSAANLPFVQDVKTIIYHDGNLIVAGTSFTSDNEFNIGIIYSQDDGATWSVSNSDALSEDSSFTTGDFKVIEDNIYYIVDSNLVNLRSSDSGLSFSEVVYGSPERAVSGTSRNKNIFLSPSGMYYITTTATSNGFRIAKTNDFLAAGEFGESGGGTDSTRIYMRIK